MRFLVDRDAAGPRAGLRGLAAAAAPVEYPEVGVYHPRLESRCGGHMSETPPRPSLVPAARARGRVGLLLLRSYLLAGNTRHYARVISALEVQGLQVVPAFASAYAPRHQKFFIQDGRSTVDAVLSLSGFSLVGGPAYNDSRAAEEVLSNWTCPTWPPTRSSSRPCPTGRVRAACRRWKAPSRAAIPELDAPPARAWYGGRRLAGSICSGCSKACTFGRRRHDQDMHTGSERTAMWWLACRASSP